MGYSLKDAVAGDRTELEARAEGHYAGPVKLGDSGDQIRTDTATSQLLLDAFRIGDSSVRANAAFALLAWQSYEPMRKALELARAYLDVSLGSPSWGGENPYPIIDAALALARGTLVPPEAQDADNDQQYGEIRT